VAITRIQAPSPNSSSRGSSTPRIIVLHTSQGATTNQNLATWVCDPASQVSYHVSVDNTTAGVCYEYVTRGRASWSVASYNPVALNGCFCTPASGGATWTRDQWLAQDTALASMAQWVAEEAARAGIPLMALTPGQAQGTGRGVCQHSDLGAAGGGHTDCGPGFPMDVLISLAAGDTPPAPVPAVMYEEELGMQLILGADGKATLPIPKYAGHLRLGCVQGGTVNVEWVGSTAATQTYDLNGKQRVDVPCGPGSNGLCVVYAGKALGPVGAAWIQVN